jgi:hypothetical protein
MMKAAPAMTPVDMSTVEAEPVVEGVKALTLIATASVDAPTGAGTVVVNDSVELVEINILVVCALVGTAVVDALPVV